MRLSYLSVPSLVPCAHLSNYSNPQTKLFWKKNLLTLVRSPRQLLKLWKNDISSIIYVYTDLSFWSLCLPAPCFFCMNPSSPDSFSSASYISPVENSAFLQNTTEYMSPLKLRTSPRPWVARQGSWSRQIELGLGQRGDEDY